MIAIAEAFFLLFEEESEDGIYWLFSNFVKKLESYLTSREEMVKKFMHILSIDASNFVLFYRGIVFFKS